MANEEQLSILKQGVDVWNRWREQNPSIKIDLSEAHLTGALLVGVDLAGANLVRANLIAADLFRANLIAADLKEAHLSNAHLGDSNLNSANLTGANLAGANLAAADLAGANLTAADLAGADLSAADLEASDLSGADLINAKLSTANLKWVNLSGADLSGADLSVTNLSGANLEVATLSGANLELAVLMRADVRIADLRNAKLCRASLIGADFTATAFTGADLRNADLTKAYLIESNLTDVDLRESNLTESNMSGAKLMDSNFSGALMARTVIASSDMNEAVGLETVIHRGPSSITTNTFVASKGKIPEIFLRGCGLSDWEIEQVKLYNPDLSNEEINNIQYQMYELRATQALQISPLFISYSRADDEFVDRIGDALTKKGVRYWRDVHEMKAGRIEKQIDRAIRQNPTVLLVLSEHSLNSDWVEHEVRIARGLEKDIVRDVFCPVALDDSWKDSKWPKRLMEQITEYNILDFSKWRDGGKFDKMFRRLIDGLALFYK